MMYFFDTDFHNLPTFHDKYGEFECSINIDNGEILVGKFPNKQLRLVSAWLEIQKKDLMANWELAKVGAELYKIEPLR